MHYYILLLLDANDGHLSSKNDLLGTSTIVGGVLLTNCAICGDRATGKHYGASSCDGCKGIYRFKYHSTLQTFYIKIITDTA